MLLLVETFVGEIGIAIVAGVVVGGVGAWLLIRSTNAGWIGSGWSDTSVISIASMAFVAANPNGSSGFVATIVYAALIVSSSELQGVSTTTTVAVVTVGVSVFAHGLTAYVGSQKYADWYEAQDHDELVEAKPVHHSLRSRLRREANLGDTATSSTPH